MGFLSAAATKPLLYATGFSLHGEKRNISTAGRVSVWAINDVGDFRVAQDIMSHFLSSKAGLLLLMLSGERSELHLQAVLPGSSTDAENC